MIVLSRGGADRAFVVSATVAVMVVATRLS